MLLRPPKATEDFVFGFTVPSLVQESVPDDNMGSPPVSGMRNGIGSCMSVISRCLENQRQKKDGIVLTIPRDDPHVMVLSTGRCGTMSLTDLLDGTNLTPYHEYWWTVEAPYRHEMQARIQSARFDNLLCADMWASTRAVEWADAILSNRPMVLLNHLDTIFAPVFAALHPLSRFVWLHRDPKDVFRSFYGKRQWTPAQLRPIRFAFDPFRYADRGYDLIPAIAWYLRFTEAFVQSFRHEVEGRFFTLLSESLFEQDRDEIAEFLDFIGSDIPIDQAVGHFNKKINEKTYKARPISDDEMQRFSDAYNSFA